MKQGKRQPVNTEIARWPWPKWLIVASILLMGFAGIWYGLQNATIFSQADGQTLQGEIIKIADGDTVTLLTRDNKTVRIRLAFIDAPEKYQSYGQTAKNNLSGLIYQQIVKVKVKDYDQYGRTIGQIFIGEKDVNLAQVCAGYAWHYKRYAKKMQDEGEFILYAKAQIEAKKSRRGLWQQANPMSPWRFRKSVH